MNAYWLPKLFLILVIRQQKSHSSLYCQNLSLSMWTGLYGWYHYVWTRYLCGCEALHVGGAFVYGPGLPAWAWPYLLDEGWTILNQPAEVLFQTDVLKSQLQTKWSRLYLFCILSKVKVDRTCGGKCVQLKRKSTIYQNVENSFFLKTHSMSKLKGGVQQVSAAPMERLKQTRWCLINWSHSQPKRKNKKQFTKVWAKTMWCSTTDWWCPVTET